jgi:hypothetical protein
MTPAILLLEKKLTLLRQKTLVLLKSWTAAVAQLLGHSTADNTMGHLNPAPRLSA